MSTFSKVLKKGKLSLGLVFPIESYSGAIPKMEKQEELAKYAEEIGFKSLWSRDVPFNDPTFGDVGQIYDPWIYITHIMNQTKEIALATGSIILPLRHPVHTAKSINSIQTLSKGRLLLGVASGDRPNEYPAFNQDLLNRAALFRDNYNYIKALQNKFPVHQSEYYGSLNGNIDLLPKSSSTTPMFVTGHSGQNLDWIAENADGWIYYPRNFYFLEQQMNDWKASLAKYNYDWKPYLQSLYIDLMENDNESPKNIHLGFKCGPKFLLNHLKMLEKHGVNHVIINLKYGTRPVEKVLTELSKHILPNFN